MSLTKVIQLTTGKTVNLQTKQIRIKAKYQNFRLRMVQKLHNTDYYH